jgi:hypothetical protein
LAQTADNTLQRKRYGATMASMMAREAWTDERLDDLNGKVDRLDNRMESGFQELRTGMAAQNRMIVQLFGGMFATMLVGFLAVIATILAQG